MDLCVYAISKFYQSGGAVGGREWAGVNWQNWQNLAIFRLRHIVQNPDKIYHKFVQFAVDFLAGIWYTYTILERVNNIFKGDFQ